MKPQPLWNALIRTHHITSRKKVSTLKSAAKDEATRVILRSGSVPGIMYVEGGESGVKRWVETVRALRYKDYQLVRKPAPIETEASASHDGAGFTFTEEESVSAFAKHMADRGIWAWWRAGMGYADGANAAVKAA